ncbi:MAG: RNA 2'-phosphotransferase [Proteobacteria bacterium]|nr:RNA 2'-phosphotransferase [Pseudomonadota bacterium]
MDLDKKPDRLSKFLDYVLTRRPDEFGLIPDPEGWFRVKELLKALSEEPEWRYVRRSHLNEVLLSAPGASIEMTENRIRARNSSPAGPASGPLPKLLYACVRAKGYSPVLERGLLPSGDQPVVLATTPEMALRMGRRRDPNPVLLTVNTAQAQDAGAAFAPRGELLYTTGSIPPGSFMGPSPGKAAAEVRDKKPKPPPEPREREWGSFIVEPAEIIRAPESLDKKGRKKRGWKEDARMIRRRGSKEEEE